MSGYVDQLVLGTMYFGTRCDERTSCELLDRFVGAGGTTIDTANAYAFWASDTGAGGQSEAVIGRWLAANPGLRDRLTIATKVGVEPVTPGDFSGPLDAMVGGYFEHTDRTWLNAPGAYLERSCRAPPNPHSS